MDTAESIAVLEGNERGFKKKKPSFKRKDKKAAKQGGRQVLGKQMGSRFHSIRAKLLLSFTVLILLMTGVSMTGYLSLQKANQNIEQLVKQDFTLVNNYNKVAYYMSRMNGSLRGYLLTGDTAYRDEFGLYGSYLDTHKNVIFKMDSSTRLNDLIEDIDGWKLYVQESVFQPYETGQQELALENMNTQANKEADRILTNISFMADGRVTEINLGATEMTTDSQAAIRWQTVLFTGAVSLSILLAFLLSGTMSKQINVIKKRLLAISQGALNEEPLYIKGGGELAELTATTNTVQEMLRKAMQHIRESAQQLATHSEELTQSAQEVKEGSEQVAMTMQELSVGAEAQAHSASELAANMEEYRGRFELAAQNGEEAKNRADSVMSLSTNGKEMIASSNEQMEQIKTIVGDAVEKMNSLENETKEISKLVAIIQSVADQTNLLALNAAIEAARAGEQGRGFAVVADEVRKLSEQVALNVKEITLSVEEIQGGSHQVAQSLTKGYQEVIAGSEKINQTDSTFTLIDESLQEVVRNVKEITEELSGLMETAQKMNLNIAEIASVSEESAAGIEETSAASQQASSTMQEVASNAKELAGLAEAMNAGVSGFQL